MLCCCCLVLLGTVSRALHLLSKSSATELLLVHSLTRVVFFMTSDPDLKSVWCLFSPIQIAQHYDPPYSVSPLNWLGQSPYPRAKGQTDTRPTQVWADANKAYCPWTAIVCWLLLWRHACLTLTGAQESTDTSTSTWHSYPYWARVISFMSNSETHQWARPPLAPQTCITVLCTDVSL